MATSRRSSKNDRPMRPPATTPETREHQVIAAAYDLAEKQIRDGTASAQVITHFLKAGTERDRLEREKLRGENSLMKARIEQIQSQSKMEELYASALAAMSSYQGNASTDDIDDPNVY